MHRHMVSRVACAWLALALAGLVSAEVSRTTTDDNPEELITGLYPLLDSQDDDNTLMDETEPGSDPGGDLWSMSPSARRYTYKRSKAYLAGMCDSFIKTTRRNSAAIIDMLGVHISPINLGFQDFAN
eukprot:scaffold122712_cov27-Prasinocladus_malaysianus.AAC.1